AVQPGTSGNPVYVAMLSGGSQSQFMGLFQSTATATGLTPADWTQSAWTLVGPTGASAPAAVASVGLNFAFNRGEQANRQDPAALVFTGQTLVPLLGSVLLYASITRQNGSWIADGFKAGQTITVTGSTSNNRT